MTDHERAQRWLAEWCRYASVDEMQTGPEPAKQEFFDALAKLIAEVRAEAVDEMRTACVEVCKRRAALENSKREETAFEQRHYHGGRQNMALAIADEIYALINGTGAAHISQKGK